MVTLSLLVGVELLLDLGDETAFTVFYIDIFVFIFFVYQITRAFFGAAITYDREKSWHSVRGYLKDVFAPARLVNSVFAFVCVYCVVSSFCIVKSLIAEINPYQFDPLFSEIDRIIHFGRYPHEYFEALLDNKAFIYFLDRLYISWYLAIYIFIAAQMYRDVDAPGRMHAIVAFCLCWSLLGNVAAIGLSSVGPIFWDLYVDAPNPYAVQLQTLNAVHQQMPLLRDIAYDALITLETNDVRVDINAPSAMPSIHIALSALFVFYAFQYCRVLFVPAIVYLILIQIASFVLGWHYALDGYVSIILMYLIWRGVGALLGKISPPVSAPTSA